MSALCSFHLRRQLNALHRHIQTRSYNRTAVEEVPIPSKEDQRAVLEATDTQLLNDTNETIDALTATATQICNETILAGFPQTHNANPAIPPYILGRHGALLRETTDILGKIQTSGANVRGHVTDLKAEPYPALLEANMEAWKKEFEGLTRAEKEETYQELVLQEAADLHRMNQRARDLMDLTERFPKTNASQHVGNPFNKPPPVSKQGSTASRIARKLEDATWRKEGSEARESEKTAEKIEPVRESKRVVEKVAEKAEPASEKPAPAKPAVPEALLAMQRQLDAALKRK